MVQFQFMLKQYCPLVEALKIKIPEHPNNAVHIKSFLLFQLYNRETVYLFFSDG